MGGLFQFIRQSLGRWAVIDGVEDAEAFPGIRGYVCKALFLPCIQATTFGVG